MQVNLSGPILVAPGEKITFTVKRVKDTPCNAAWEFEGWSSIGPAQRPDDHTLLQVCTAPTGAGAACTATVAVDFRKDPAGTYDPAEEYDVTLDGQTGHSITIPFGAPPVLNGQTFNFQVSNP